MRWGRRKWIDPLLVVGAVRINCGSRIFGICTKKGVAVAAPQPFELEHAILDAAVRYQHFAVRIRRSFERFIEAGVRTLLHDFLWHFR